MGGINRQNNVIYRVIVWILLILCSFILIRIAPTLSNAKYLPSDDFVQFWAGGRLNIHHENPFDLKKIEQLQITAGGEPSGLYTISILLNPPWAITLAMPFGLLYYSISRFSWLISSTLIILLSTLILWRIYNGKPNQRWLALLVVFIFAPTISVLEVGQITIIILFGITGFLYYSIVSRNDWLAGAFLAIASIKPQVAYLFWIALLLWIIHEHRWFLFFSTSLYVFLLLVVTWLFNPHVLEQYFEMLQTYQISEWANPTIGAYLRFFWFGIDKFWLQFLPSIIGCAWIIYYWIRHQRSWNWKDELPILLIISQITSPYSWTYDQVILIPAILQATIWITYDWKRWLTIFVAIYYITISILDLLLHQKLSDFWFIWMAPAFLILYLIIRWQYKKNSDKHILADLVI